MGARSRKCTPWVVATAAVNPARVAVREIDVDSSIDSSARRPFYARFTPGLTRDIPEITQDLTVGYFEAGTSGINVTIVWRWSGKYFFSAS